jgi:phosphopantothenoylcysteine synthetase/decarboxylase
VSRADGGFDVDTNAATLISANGEVDTPVQLKSELASTIVDRIEQLLSTRAAAAKQS